MNHDAIGSIDALVTSIRRAVVAQTDLNDVIQEVIEFMGEAGHRIVEVMAFSPGRVMMHSLTAELMASIVLAKTIANEPVFKSAVAELCSHTEPRGIGIKYLDEVVHEFVEAAIAKDSKDEAMIDAVDETISVSGRMDYVKVCILSTLTSHVPRAARGAILG